MRSFGLRPQDDKRNWFQDDKRNWFDDDRFNWFHNAD